MIIDLTLIIGGYLVCYLIFNLKKDIKKPRRKKDNSKKTDYFSNCRCCGQYIRGDYRSNFDKRYCQDCL